MQLQLTIVTQEKELISTPVDSITTMTTSGEVTILPNHIPLITKLSDTEFIYRVNNSSYSLAISGGFMNVEPNNTVVVLTDSAIRSEDIDEAKVEEARRKAAEDMQDRKKSSTELLLAEGELRKAILQLKVLHRKKSSTY